MSTNKTPKNEINARGASSFVKLTVTNFSLHFRSQLSVKTSTFSTCPGKLLIFLEIIANSMLNYSLSILKLSISALELFD